MIQCIRLWTGDDAESHFEEGLIELEPGTPRRPVERQDAGRDVSFQERHPAARSTGTPHRCANS